jgi:hypothetical protein
MTIISMEEARETYINESDEGVQLSRGWEVEEWGDLGGRFEFSSKRGWIRDESIYYGRVRYV